MTAGRHRHALSGLAIAALATTVLVGCGHAGATGRRSSASTPLSAPSTATTGHANIGALTITGAYIPQPASPDVAAAYLRIANAGASADAVVKVTTDVTNSVMAMNETDHDGVGTMTGLRSVTIPPHGSVSLTPGHSHLMLEKPTSRLRIGQHVAVTITFAHAGTVTLAVPVVPLTGPVTGTGSTPMFPMT